MTTWAIIPVKPLRDSKSRLAHILSADERANLTTTILQHTLQVLADAPSVYRALVISRDPAILKLARQAGAYTFGEGEKLGLNVALVRGSHVAAAQGASSILVLPADLPFLSVGDVETMLSSASPVNGNRPAGSTNGAGYANTRAVAITPDRTQEGTNALFLCPPLGFEFQFGPGSFQRHLQEAERLGITCRVVHAPGLKFDLDTEEDWRTYLTLRGASAPVS